MEIASACFSLCRSTIRENSVSKKDRFSLSVKTPKFGSPIAITFKLVCSILCPRMFFVECKLQTRKFFATLKMFWKKRKNFCTGKPLRPKHNRYSKTQIGSFFSYLKNFLPIFSLRLYHTDFRDTTDFTGRFVPSP